MWSIMCVYIQVNTADIQKSKHTGTWSVAARQLRRLCYRPGVFFLHFCLTEFSFAQREIRRAFQKCYFNFFYCFKIAWVLNFFSRGVSECPSVWVSERLSVWASECLSVWVSECLSVLVFECLSIWMSERLSLWLSECLSVLVSEYLSVWASKCLSVWVSERLSVRVSEYLSVWVSVFETNKLEMTGR